MLKKRIAALALIFILLVHTAATALELDSQAAISMNYETGEIYFEKNSDTLMTPASLTKIMTLYIIFEKMSQGEFSLQTMIPISQNAATLSITGDATNIPLTEGSSIKVSELIEAIVVVSACACTTVMAEYISGSEEAFASLMNETAKELGIEAIFYDASGLSNDNLISPKAIACLIRTFVEKHPEILEYTSKTEIVIDEKKYESTNRLLPIKNTEHYYEGADGFKTGTTSRAGKCLAATALRDGKRVITVAMKAKSNYNRYDDAIRLLDNAFYHISYFGGNIFSTDIKAYINEIQIPCCYKMFDGQELCIIAEQLNFYGFNTHYDEETHSLYITENKNKELSPVLCENEESGNIKYKVYEHPELKAFLVKGGEVIPLKTAVSIGGQCLISFDELGSYYEKSWDSELRIAKIKMDSILTK